MEIKGSLKMVHLTLYNGLSFIPLSVNVHSTGKQTGQGKFDKSVY